MIRRIANAVADLEGLSFIATLVIGIAALGYVVVRWTLHLVAAAQYLYAGALCILALLILLLATLRIPAAQLALLGAAFVVGVGYVTGTQGFFLP